MNNIIADSIVENVKNPSVSSVVITGLVIVFAMLLFFVLLFGGFGKLMNAASNARKGDRPAVPKENKAEIKAAKVAAKAASKSAKIVSPAVDDELIAVISAAVYTMYEGSGKRPVIKSIRPAARSGKSAWAMAGIYNNIKSF